MHYSSQLHVKQKSSQSIPKLRVHSNVRISQFSGQTVPDSRYLNCETMSHFYASTAVRQCRMHYVYISSVCVSVHACVCPSTMFFPCYLWIFT